MLCPASPLEVTRIQPLRGSRELRTGCFHNSSCRLKQEEERRSKSMRRRRTLDCQSRSSWSGKGSCIAGMETTSHAAAPKMRAFFSGPLVLTQEPADTRTCCSSSVATAAAASRKLLEGVGGGAGEHLRKWSEREAGSSCRADASSFRSEDYSEQEQRIPDSLEETHLEASSSTTPAAFLQGTRHDEDHHQQEGSATSLHHDHDQLQQLEELLLLSQSGRANEAASYMRRKCGSSSRDVRSSWNQAAVIVEAGGASLPAAAVPKLSGSSSRDEKLVPVKRRPTASIAWDALNTSQESSPQHELAAIPFRWEEAPGKPKSTTTSLEQQQDCVTISPGRLLRQPQQQPGMSSRSTSFRSSHRFYATTTQTASSSSEVVAAAVAAADQTFGSSRRSSMDIAAHMISEIESEAHIDLVAPAAAKFLVESCPLISSSDDNTSGAHVLGSKSSSSCSTLEDERQEPASIIPFKWEEAPGKPKHQELAKSSLRRMQSLQLPPRLLASPHRSASMICRQFELELELGQQHHRTSKYVSMSGPLIGYYQRSSPAAELMSPSFFSPAKLQHHQQHQPASSTTRTSSSKSLRSPTRRRLQRSPSKRLSKSPSKRSISPSKIQALAKHLAHKTNGANAATEAAGIVAADSDGEELNWHQTEYNNVHNNILRHSFTSGHTSGPLEGAYKRSNSGHNSNAEGGSKAQQQQLLGRNSRPMTFTSEHHHRSGPLESTTPLSAGLKSQSRSKSPSMVAVSGGMTMTRTAAVVSPLRMAMSPSRIHALAKQLTTLRRATSAPSPPHEFTLDSALEDLNWPVQAKNVRQSLFTTPPSKPKGSSIVGGGSESTGSEGWADGQQQQQQQARIIQEIWSPRSILHGPFRNCQTLTSDPSSSASDRDTQTQTSAASDRDTQTQTSGPSDRDIHPQTASNAALMNTLSQSLSCASYESFEHSFTDNASPTSSFPATTWDHASCSSPIGSPFFGPITTADYGHAGIKGAAAASRGGGASEGVRAIMKLCRTGSHHWRRSKHKHKVHNTEIWAPTLATAFQSSLDLNGPVLQSDSSSIGGNNKSLAQHLAEPNSAKNGGAAACLQEEHDDSSSSPVESSSPEAQTRLPYTMPSVAEQDAASCGGAQDYCDDSPKTHSAPCLGVKLSPVKFMITSVETPTAWSNRGTTTSTSSTALHDLTSNPGDGYRSPAYTATLELLSPSSDLLSKKRKKEFTKSHSIRLRIPSRKIRRKTSLIERIYRSLKRALHKCIRHCYPKTGRLFRHHGNAQSNSEFSFS